MHDKQIKISRKDLYERDWATPLRTLAKEFGLSDVGLAKLCRRHNIPLPGRGYWVRMQFGKKQERTALPDEKDVTVEIIVIISSESRSYEKDLPPRPSSILTVQIPEGDRREHPIASKIAKAFVKARPDDKGMLVPQSGQISAVGLSAPMTVIALPSPRPLISWESEELDDCPHALFLAAGRKSLGS